jgi:hypothetical protein
MHAADVPSYPLRAARRDVVVFEGSVVIGAAGAVSSTDVDEPTMTVTLGTTGQYALVLPPAKKGRLYWGWKTAAGTVKIAYLTAFSPTAGTATLQFANDAGVATAPASGDEFWFMYRADSRGE